MAQVVDSHAFEFRQLPRLTPRFLQVSKVLARSDGVKDVLGIAGQAVEHLDGSGGQWNRPGPRLAVVVAKAEPTAFGVYLLPAQGKQLRSSKASQHEQAAGHTVPWDQRRSAAVVNLRLLLTAEQAMCGGFVQVDSSPTRRCASWGSPRRPWHGLCLDCGGPRLPLSLAVELPPRLVHGSVVERCVVGYGNHEVLVRILVLIAGQS
jgi:hypothetical protein